MAIAKRVVVFFLVNMAIMLTLSLVLSLLGVGRNYGAHAKEAGLSPSEQKQPRIFAKFSSSVIGPDAGIPKPKAVEKLDYETELAVVIGKRARNVSEAEAGSVIAGYTIVNDVSAREAFVYLFQKRY